jgi:hypothetical protein
MPKKMILTAVALTIFMGATVASAQPRPNKSWKSWFGHADLSYALAEGEAGNVLDDGFSIGGGATYWPEQWKIGLVLDLDYTEFDISNSTIRNINQAIIDGGGSGTISGGDASLWSLSINGTWSPSDTGEGFYVIGGIGGYDVDARVTEDALVWYPPICDPWFWWCTPGGVGPGTAVRASTSSTEFGWNAGLGWAFEVGEGSQLYIEARFHSVDTSPEATEFLPLTIGFRW